MPTYGWSQRYLSRTRTISCTSRGGWPKSWPKPQPHGAVWANQFDNTANRDYHEQTTAAEIWAQTEGSVDAFISAVGTGGTLAGTARGLKARNPAIRIGLADPQGSALYNWFTHGELRAEGSSISEGIGTSRITANFEGTPVDAAFQIPDERIQSRWSMN